jgi:hypothetical protein
MSPALQNSWKRLGSCAMAKHGHPRISKHKNAKSQNLWNIHPVKIKSAYGRWQRFHHTQRRPDDRHEIRRGGWGDLKYHITKVSAPASTFLEVILRVGVRLQGSEPYAYVWRSHTTPTITSWKLMRFIGIFVYPQCHKETTEVLTAAANFVNVHTNMPCNTYPTSQNFRIINICRFRE